MASILQKEDDDKENDRSNIDKSSDKQHSIQSRKIARIKPSRSERKALERVFRADAKSRQRRKHNYSERKDHLASQTGPNKLHSTAIPELNQQSTAEDVIRAIKRAQNLHDHHDLKIISQFLLEHTDDSFAYGYKGSLLSRLAVAALHLGDHAIATSAMESRRINFQNSMLPMESAAVVRNLLRVHNVTLAWQILEDELSVPLPGTDVGQNRDKLVHRAGALASMASQHFFKAEPRLAIYALNKLQSLGSILHDAEISASDLDLPWARLLQGASRCQSMIRDGTVSLASVENSRTRNNKQQYQNLDPHDVFVPCNVVYSVLDAMNSVPSENDDAVYELLSNALVRRVEFVRGATTMDHCPVADRGEAAFIGRSNVGKSSLVNMITKRKSLAYTSKRPGKTQQFNFFAVNDKHGLEREIKYGDEVHGEKDADSFYLVDLPGFGYAKVPEKQRREWGVFMKEYISSRQTLRVLFHLIDSRHGPTEEDELIMRYVNESLPPYAQYVVVLTKADKNVKGEAENFSGKVSLTVMNVVNKALENNFGSSNAVPIILSSAETKLGQDQIWRYLCRTVSN